jgi:hypothetical protein
MAETYTNIFQSKALQKNTQIGIFGLKIYRLATLACTVSTSHMSNDSFQAWAYETTAFVSDPQKTVSGAKKSASEKVSLHLDNKKMWKAYASMSVTPFTRADPLSRGPVLFPWLLGFQKNLDFDEVETKDRLPLWFWLPLTGTKNT